jgi:hypothetical protein
MFYSFLTFNAVLAALRGAAAGFGNRLAAILAMAGAGALGVVLFGLMV